MIDFAFELARLHAPLLIVTLPLIGAALVVAVARPLASWLLAFLIALGVALFSADLFARVLLSATPLLPTQEALSIGADSLGVFSVTVIAVMAAVALCAAGAFTADLGRGPSPFAFALTLGVSGGWSGAVLARDFITMFLFVEIAWLSSVGLTAIAAGKERGGLNGALRMLCEGGVASVFLLVGVGLVERGSGSGTIASLASGHISALNTTAVGVALIVVALAWKCGLAPLNAWAAAAFGRTSGLATLVLGGVGGAGAVLTLAHVASAALAAPNIGTGIALSLCVLAMVGAVVASLQAIGATTIRRLAAYAMAAQMACALLGVALGSPAGLEAAVVQVVGLSASTVALFGAALLGGVGPALSSLDGLGRRAPIAGLVMTVGALNLMGAPLTLSFLGRWQLIEAALGIGWWWAAGAAILVSLAGSYYGGRLIERVYFRHASQTSSIGASPIRWKIFLTPAALVSVVVILSAVEPTILLNAAHAASLTLMDRDQ